MKSLYEELGLDLDKVGRKDPLWNLIEPPFKEDNLEKCFVGGCGIGTGCFDVLHDGTVMSCRRHPGSIIGKLPENTLEQIFFESERLIFLRDVEKIRKCQDCDFLWNCRGCRAVAYGTTGDFFAPDPQCWL